MKKTNLILGLALSAFLAGPLSADDFVPPTIVSCTVTTVVPEHAGFFGNLGKRIHTGDTIKLDFSYEFINELKFDSGAAIPLKQANAQLFLQSSSPFTSHYEGRAETFENNYLGVLHAQHDTAGSEVTIQVLQHKKGRLLTLHSLTMSCLR